MAEMTRAEARGILQQLVKQQQAVVRLADAVSADAALEAEVAALRSELGRLTQAITQSRSEIETLKVSMAEAAVATREAWDVSVAAQQELADTRKAVDEAKRQADGAIARSAKEADTSRQARLLEVEQAVAQKRLHVEAEHTERLGSMRKELDALQERKEAITREIAGMLSRFGAR